ncbi:MAG: sulfurtransferase complex subunit TusB [Pseudomonadales bacterium]|nr:sulfurtransferase complex subunit TusB [Pseudomonadales bacterium]
MSTCHIVHKDPHQSTAFEHCVKTISANDAIVLIENGVYSLLNKHWIDTFKQLDSANTCYVLTPDIEARGLLNKVKSLNIQPIKFIDYREFVELCAQHQRTASWL